MDTPKSAAGQGTEILYYVEARSTFSEPKIIDPRRPVPFVLDNKWRRIPLSHDPSNPLTVPVRPTFGTPWYSDLMNEEAGLALAYLFLAELASHYDGACVECRLVKVTVKYSYTTEESGVGPIINRSDGPRTKYEPREAVEIPLSAREVSNGK